MKLSWVAMLVLSTSSWSIPESWEFSEVLPTTRVHNLEVSAIDVFVTTHEINHWLEEENCVIAHKLSDFYWFCVSESKLLAVEKAGEKFFISQTRLLPKVDISLTNDFQSIASWPGVDVAIKRSSSSLWKVSNEIKSKITNRQLPVVLEQRNVGSYLLAWQERNHLHVFNSQRKDEVTEIYLFKLRQREFDE